MADFEKNVRIYQANLRKNACQNEDALVANALNPFLQNLGFDTAVKDKQEGASEVDLTIQKDENVKIIIEAKKAKRARKWRDDCALWMQPQSPTRGDFILF